MGKLLLERVDTLLHHLDDLWIATKLLTVLKRDIVLAGILLQKRIDRDDECGDKLTLVSDDTYLVDILVNQQFRLDHLRCDILAVAGLEEILDTLRQEQLTIFQVTSITCLEITILCEGSLRQVLTVIIPRGDRRTLQEDLSLLTDFDINSLYRLTHGPYGIGSS